MVLYRPSRHGRAWPICHFQLTYHVCNPIVFDTNCCHTVLADTARPGLSVIPSHLVCNPVLLDTAWLGLSIIGDSYNFTIRNSMLSITLWLLVCHSVLPLPLNVSSFYVELETQLACLFFHGVVRKYFTVRPTSMYPFHYNLCKLL